jgi:hypothetical protein
LFFFGHVKHCLQGMIFQSHDKSLEEIREIVAAIPAATLHGIFEQG